jgi:hypothetical protein
LCCGTRRTFNNVWYLAAIGGIPDTTKWPGSPQHASQRPRIYGREPKMSSKPKQLASTASAIAAGRVPKCPRGAPKIYETDPAQFRRTPFLMCDRLFRIQKIAAFGGGVKRDFSKAKRGVGLISPALGESPPVQVSDLEMSPDLAPASPPSMCQNFTSTARRWKFGGGV